MVDAEGASRKVVFWHRELPPTDAEMVSEHVVEASSGRVAGSLARGAAAWDRCYEDLMANAIERLVQEVERLNGDYARVTDESTEAKHDGAKDESWLHGTFKFVLYRSQRSGTAHA
jgi:hypothetical protein